MRELVIHPSSASARRRHLYDVDVVRLVTVLGVLCVHGTSLLLPTSEWSGATLALLHATREVFVFLSAFVLAYATPLPIDRQSFWRRRFPLIIVPYVAWSAVFVLADGRLTSPTTVLARYGVDLLDSGARFHLYFLLLTFQLYLVFPWLRGWVARRRHHGRILVGVLVWQVVFTSAIHYRAVLPPPLSTWLSHPGTWLPSYALYVVAGIIAALHLEEVRAWVDDHHHLIALATAVAFALALLSYERDLRIGHFGPLHAGEVFSPGVVLVSVAAIAAQFALGSWVVRRSGPRILRLLRTSSDVSFGVYLAHPLVYQTLIAALAASGVHHGFAGLPAGIGLLLVLFVVAPSTYLVTAFGIWLLRRTPASLASSGRRLQHLVPGSVDDGSPILNSGSIPGQVRSVQAAASRAPAFSQDPVV